MAKRKTSLETKLVWGALLAAALVAIYRAVNPAPGLDAAGIPLQGLRSYRGVG